MAKDIVISILQYLYRSVSQIPIGIAILLSSLQRIIIQKISRNSSNRLNNNQETGLINENNQNLEVN